MGWWWRSDVQTPVLKPSDPTPDPQRTALNPPASLRELANKKPASSSAMQQQDELDELLFPTQSTGPRRDAPDSSLYPSTMSCREAFDAAYYCASFGGKFNDIYRYGELRPCSDHWAQWRFCMRLKVLQPSEREESVRDFYREKEAHTRVGKNSETVWNRRVDLPDKYMWKNPDTMRASDGEDEKA